MTNMNQVTTPSEGDVLYLDGEHGPKKILVPNYLKPATDKLANLNSRITAIEELRIRKKIYGVYWDGGPGHTFSRTDDAALFSSPQPSIDGSQGSSPFDGILPWDGMQIVNDPVAGALVSIPKYYYKWTKTDSAMQLQISMYPHPGFHVSPAHGNRGDGYGERDVVYIGRYLSNTTNYKSLSGYKPDGTGVTKATYRTRFHNLGAEYWNYDYAMFWTLAMLYLVEYADWDTSEAICYSHTYPFEDNTGMTDNVLYHTGGTEGSKIQYRYIEDFFGGGYILIDGLRSNNNDVYLIYNPSQFSDTANGTKIGSFTGLTSSDGYIVKSFSIPQTDGLEWALFPNATLQTYEKVYVTDSIRFKDFDGAHIGILGCPNNDSYNGMFRLDFMRTATYEDDTSAARLQKLPNS